MRVVPCQDLLRDADLGCCVPCLFQCARTPRGFPAPGGAPMQYTKAHIRHPLVLLANKNSGEDKDERAVLKQRPARPFTHASHERANDIFHDGMYHMSDKRNLPLAERHFREVIKIDPNHVGALSYLGVIEQDHRQNYASAADFFLRALALEPNNPVALGGYALWQQNCGCNQASNPWCSLVLCPFFFLFHR